MWASDNSMGFTVLFVIFGSIALISVIVRAILAKKTEKAKKTQVEQYIQTASPLQSACKILINLELKLRDNSAFKITFSLNNGRHMEIKDGDTVELSTSVKENIITAYYQVVASRTDKKISARDTPFTFEAVDNGLIRLFLKPEFTVRGDFIDQFNVHIRMENDNAQ